MTAPQAETTANNFHNYLETLEESFPRAVPQNVFIEHANKVLNSHGFNSKSSINLVSHCRDEICKPFTEAIDSTWEKPSFNIASLAGMVYCGRTGFKAAMAHAPIVDGKERYVIWVASHIALGEGEPGMVYRPGRDHASTACGALLAALREIQSGKLNVQLDPTDLEMSLLKQQIVGYLRYGQVPTLVELTYAVHECILADVQRTAQLSVDRDMCEYVIISGIQVHGAQETEFFWPGTFVKYTSSGMEDLYEEYATSVADWTKNDLAEMSALALMQKKEREARLAVKRGDLKRLKKFDLSISKIRDNSRRSLLHVAAMHGKVQIAEFLLKSVDDDLAFVNLQDNLHLTAMDYAVQHEHDELAEMLMEHGGGLEGEWLEEELVKAVSKCDLNQLSKLMWYAKDIQTAIKSTNKDGKSLVHICAATRDTKRAEMLQLLLSFGADANFVDFYGNNAALAIQERQDKELIEVLESPKVSFDLSSATAGIEPLTFQVGALAQSMMPEARAKSLGISLPQVDEGASLTES